MRTNNKPTNRAATFHGGVARANEPMGRECSKCGARRVDRQIGLEKSPDEFVAALVEVFREVRRVLRDDGTVWLNLGDSYYSPTATQGRNENRSATSTLADHGRDGRSPALDGQMSTAYRRDVAGVKPKDLLGIPWLVAFALRADGWYLRSEVIWSKPNPMPESVSDRPTKAHEQVFLLSKRATYHHDADAIREPQVKPPQAWLGSEDAAHGKSTGPMARGEEGFNHQHVRDGRLWGDGGGRNRRSVWTVATQPLALAHFATFPPKLIEPMILAGCPERCCAECGAPWERVVEVESRPNWAGNGTQKHDGTYYRENIGGGVGNDRRERRELGFAPSCSCDNGTTPGTVLDPFAGAGTTGVVALRHNRSFVGVELSPKYAEMARWRIRDDQPLFNGQSEAA